MHEPDPISSKWPYYELYPRDLLADILLLEDMEELLYRRLLDYQWLHGSIPTELRLLAKAGRMSPAAAAKHWPAIADRFPDDGQGRRINRRLQRQMNQLNSKKESQSEAGRIGARARWQPHTDRISDTDATAMRPRCPATASTTVVNKLPEWETDFAVAWGEYPKCSGNVRKAALRAYLARRKEGVSAETLLAGVRGYATFCRRTARDPQFVKMASTFFGPNEHYLTDFGPVEDEKIFPYLDEHGIPSADGDRPNPAFLRMMADVK